MIQEKPRAAGAVWGRRGARGADRSVVTVRVLEAGDWVIGGRCAYGYESGECV